MHAEAWQWVKRCVADLGLSGRVLDLGGRQVNYGSIRTLIPHDHWVGVDLRAGSEVDVVGNAATVEVEPGTWDVVVSTELLEHTPEGAGIVANAYRHLKPGGWFVATMAGEGRAPHGASGEARVPAGEHYENVTVAALTGWLEAAGFSEYTTDTLGADLRCWARKGGG